MRGLTLSKIGVSKHDIWAVAGEYWEITRPERFGWTVLLGEEFDQVLNKR